MSTAVEDTATSQTVLEIADFAEMFLRSGGSLRWSDWSHMDETHKAAFLLASRRVEIDRALTLAKALGGGKERAKLYAEIDGGDAHVRQVLVDRAKEWITEGKK